MPLCNTITFEVGLEQGGHRVMGERKGHCKQRILGKRTRGKHTWQDLEGMGNSLTLIGKER